MSPPIKLKKQRDVSVSPEADDNIYDEYVIQTYRKAEKKKNRQSRLIMPK